MTELKAHPAVLAFPPMADKGFISLVQSVREEGLRESIEVHEGVILSGWSRYRACMIAGVKPSCRSWRGNGESPALYAIRCSLSNRPGLSKEDRAIIGSDLYGPVCAELRKGCKFIASHDDRGERAKVRLSRALGVGETLLQLACYLRSRHPESLELVKSGKSTLWAEHRRVCESNALQQPQPPQPQLSGRRGHSCTQQQERLVLLLSSMGKIAEDLEKLDLSEAVSLMPDNNLRFWKLESRKAYRSLLAASTRMSGLLRSRKENLNANVK